MSEELENTEELPSMEDEMLAIVQGIEAKEKGDEATIEPEVGAFERARDETGKFTRAAEKAAAAAEVPKVGDPAKPAEQAFDDRGPPSSWRAPAKARWGELTPELKAEIYKREQDTFNGIGQYQAKAQIADGLMSTIQPYKPIMDALGSDIPTALNEVLRTAAVFHVGTPEQKAATLRTIAQRHGIDLGQAVNNGQDQFRDPAIESLQKEIASLKGVLANQQQASQNSELMQAHGEISAFQNDPSKKYFRDVAYQMGQLMQAGLASSMQEAYDKACEINPQVKAALQIERDQDKARKDAAERQQRATTARKAGSLAVRSTPTPAPTTGKPKPWMEAMDDYYAQIQGNAA